MPKDSEGSTGSSYIVDRKNRKVLIPIDVNKIEDIKELLGTVTEEVAHGKDALEGRQDKKVAEDNSNDEEGLETLGRPTNDYFKKQYSKNDKAIDLKSDGKDYSNVDFGENVGDKEIKNIFKSTDEEYITKEEKRNAEKILEKEYGKKYEVDWEQYDDINGFNYRRKINYLVYQAENRINDLSEIENGNFETVPKKESVLHNFIKTKDGIKIVISDSLRNIKKVDYETGKEVVISKSNKIVKDYMNQGTSNNYTYGFNNPKPDEGKFDKGLHFLSNIVNYIFEGMGVQDETTIRERINMSILGG